MAQRHPVDVNMLAQHVARGAGDIVVTMAASRPASAFSRLDFPAFRVRQSLAFIPSRSRPPRRFRQRTASRSAMTPLSRAHLSAVREKADPHPENRYSRLDADLAGE